MACRDCLSGSLHEGTPVGREETVHGLPTYISEPPAGQDPKGIIVYIPDAFGWTFNNNRILADAYAKRTNSRVYLPEFMAGHHLPIGVAEDMDIVTGNGWMIGKILPMVHAIYCFIPFIYHNRHPLSKPRVYKFLSDLRAHESASLPVGVAGFCWGGKFVILLCSDAEKATGSNKSLVDCGFTAHPSGVVVPAEIDAVTLPLSIANGDVDVVMPLAQVQQAKAILEGKGKDRHEVVIVSGGKHGFAVRGEPTDEKAVEKGKQAEDQAVEWFTKWFEKYSQAS